VTDLSSLSCGLIAAALLVCNIPYNLFCGDEMGVEYHIIDEMFLFSEVLKGASLFFVYKANIFVKFNDLLFLFRLRFVVFEFSILIVSVYW
jgi:hypothetical protein